MDSYGSVELYLIRHGVTQWNLEKRYLGWTDQSLFDQEKFRLDELRNALNTVHFDKCYSSDLTRCKETLSSILPEQELSLDQRLREMNFGDWEGKTYETLKDNVRYQNWLMNWEGISPPGGENGKTFQTRVLSFFKELFDTYQKVDHRKDLIVTHGGVIRYVLSTYINELSFWEVPVKNNRGYVLNFRYRNGGWICCSWSEVPFQENAGL
jgi:alpha-ribazole phosphatase